MNEDNGKDGKPISAAIYARTSSPNQRYNHSIKEQVKRCWKYCDDRGWAVRYVFVDECESGGTTDRPKFQAMLEKARAGEFNVIVFWKLDRFCRSLVDLVNIERNLRELEVGLSSATEHLDTTTSVGRFNFRNLASVAELEREMIGERARIGLHALAREHKWPNPHPPLGYDKTDGGTLRVDREEAKLVRWIFKRYIRTKSMDQVAFELNTQGAPTKRGKKWTARAVKDVLTDGLYTGKYKVAGVEEHVEGFRIVKDQLFSEVNELRIRYENGDGAKRPPMPEDRRMAKIERVFHEYFEFLSDTENNSENLSYQ
jgi:site-specific DNA recombinase